MAKRSTNRLAAAPPPTLLPGESIEAYNLHRRAWYEEFPPNSDLEIDFIKRLCQRSWTLKRCERMYHDALTQTMLANPDSLNWSPETHKYLQLIERYRLNADRAYRAAWRDIEVLRRNRFEAAADHERLKRLLYLNDRLGLGPKPVTPKPTPPNPTHKNPFLPKDTNNLLGGINNE